MMAAMRRQMSQVLDRLPAEGADLSKLGNTTSTTKVQYSTARPELALALALALLLGRPDKKYANAAAAARLAGSLGAASPS